MSNLDPSMPSEFTFSPIAFEARNYSSLAALVFLVLECLSNSRAEYNFIWRAPTTVVKFIYLISRYSALLGLAVHYCLIHLFLIDAPVKLEQCRIWYIFTFGICATTMAALDIILLLRVYALYGKNVRVYVLALPLIPQFVVASILMERASHTDMFNSHCDKDTSPIDCSLMGSTVLLAHVALWVATFRKRNLGDAAVLQLVIREGACIVLMLVGIIATTLAFAVVSDSSNLFVIFVWPTALISTITCRIILNMQTLKIESPGSTDLYLSTIISDVV